MFGLRRPQLKTPDQLQVMRRAGLVVERTLTAVSSEVRPGLTTGELDMIAAEVIASADATPSFLGYGEDRRRSGFTGVICVSVNAEILHGVPGDRVLAEGDLLSIDCGAIVDGWHADAAVTVPVGRVSEDQALLRARTREALWTGIAAVRPGGRVSDVSAAVEGYVDGIQSEHGVAYGIVEEYVGHGIGTAMHMFPDVPNVGPPGRGPRIVPGLTLAIEPMLTAGEPDNHVLDDGWTVVTDDGAAAAHWEHTVAVTDTGLWVLTAEDGGEAELTRRGAPFGPVPGV